MPVFLADTTVLSNFAQIGRPDLLRSAFPGLATPEAVREELARGERLGLVPVCDWSWLTTVELTGAEQSRGEARIVMEHQSGVNVKDVYLQVYSNGSSAHVFARISIRRL
jgi:hypothetical protein